MQTTTPCFRQPQQRRQPHPAFNGNNNADSHTRLSTATTMQTVTPGNRQAQQCRRPHTAFDRHNKLLIGKPFDLALVWSQSKVVEFSPKARRGRLLAQAPLYQSSRWNMTLIRAMKYLYYLYMRFLAFNPTVLESVRSVCTETWFFHP
jgi:hypothetical protein